MAEYAFDVVLVAPHERDEEVDGVLIRAVKQPGGRLQRIVRTTAEVVRIALEEDADLYHVHDPELLPWVLSLRRRGTQVIYDMHENLPFAVRTKPWVPRVIRRVLAAALRGVERPFLRKMPVVLAERSYESDYAFVKTRTTVLNLPRAEDLLPLHAVKRSTYTIGYMGAVSPNRGALVTLRALEILHGAGLPVAWDCIGPITEECRARFVSTDESATGPAIHIRGRMPYSDGLELLASCHAGVAVLQPLPNYCDSYPTKLFEYMGLGLPVIASNFPLYREVIEGEDCGICVDPTNAEEVASAFRHLIENPAEAEEMGNRGREAVRTRYNWRAEGRKLTAFYGQLLNSPAFPVGRALKPE